MKKISYLISLVFLILGMNVYSQEDNNWVAGKIISDIQFEGLDNISVRDLDGVVNPYIGLEFDDELFLELQTLMYELDYFEFIVPSAKKGDDDTVIIVFQVQESPSISKIVFEGNDSVWNTTLSGKIVLKSKDIYSDYKIERAKNGIIEEYHDKGFSNVTVEVEKESNPEKNSLKIIFIIDEGEQTLIRDIRFNGNNIFAKATDKKLGSLIETKKKSLFEDGVYKESVIQGDKLLIEGHYHNNGYINARVIDIKTSLTPDEKKPELKNMEIDFYIDEGEQYTYGGMEITGNEEYPTEDFMELDRQKVGQIYDKGRHDADYLAMRDLYWNNGFIENLFDDQKIIDEESKVISHKIVIVERPIAHIGKVTVSGNERTKDIVLFRDIPIKSGDVYSKEKVAEAWRNLMHTQLFTAIKPMPRKNDDGDMDIEFVVEEQRTFMLQGGISVAGSDFEPQLQFQISENNFMGMGRTLGGQLNLGLKEQMISFNYTEPRINNTNFWGSISLSFTHKQKDIHVKKEGSDTDISTAAEERLKISGYEKDVKTNNAIISNPDSTQEAIDAAIKSNKTLATDIATSEKKILVDTDGYYLFPAQFDSIDEYEENKNKDPDESNPDLHAYNISFGLNGGYSWYKPWGIVKASTGYSTGVSTFFHDEGVVPFDEEYDENQGVWVYNDFWSIKGQIDGRDAPVGTTKGYSLSQHISIGGILPFERTADYIRTKSSAEKFFKLVDTPASEDWDFVLTFRLHAAYQRLFAKPGMDLNIHDDSKIRMTGFLEGRGWRPESNGIALLDLKAELLMPIVPNVVGTSLFLDGVNIWQSDEDLATFALEDFKFSVGGSLGITNPMMPISFYVCRTFDFQDGDITWNRESYNNLNDQLKWGITFNLNQFVR